MKIAQRFMLTKTSLKIMCEIIIVLLFSSSFFSSLPHDPYVNLHLARYYVNLRQDCVAAIKLLQSETTAYPDNIELHITLAQCYLKLGAYGKAVPHLKKVLSLQPDNKHVLQILKSLKYVKKK